MNIEQWLNTDLGRKIWEGKYRYNNESLEEWFDRVSGKNSEVRQLIKEKKFLFGGRTLSNRGLNDGSYSNCYSSGYVEDDLVDIMNVNTKLALTYKAQGGQGVSLSKIRPKGTLINNRYESDGIVPIMEMYNKTTESIMQGGSRKGALMLSIDITHKEAETFITIKSDITRINKANLSVEIDDEFMRIVQKSYNDKIEYSMSITRQYEKQTINYDIIPIKLYKLLIKAAHTSAEPGVIFVDKFRNYNLMEFVDKYQIETCNPCGEQPLAKDSACNLGSINLSEYISNPFTSKASFKFTSFVRDVKTCIRGLDEIIDENLPNHALDVQREMSRKYRNIGLGIMGFADALIKLQIKYGSYESVRFIEEICKIQLIAAVEASVELAREKGAFPEYTEEVFDASILKGLFPEERLEEFKKIGIRNCSLLSIAPTGSLGTMLNISTGLEPNFALEYSRKTEALEGKEQYHKVFAGIALEYTEKFKTTELPDYFVTSHNLDWDDRIDIQSAAQRYIDTAISSTINLPSDISLEEVEELYLYAWMVGLKGVTIYRDGCRDGILTLEKPKETIPTDFFTRPEILEAKVIHFLNGTEKWIAFIGVKENKPFEIFSGPSDMDLFPIPKSIHSGEIIKVKTENHSRYDFSYIDSYGYKNTLGGLSRMFNKEYWNYARLLSGMLRNQVPTESVVEIIDSMHSESESLHSWKNGVIRALKTFIKDGTKTKENCTECGGEIVYIGGCKQCTSCGDSKCG